MKLGNRHPFLMMAVTLGYNLGILDPDKNRNLGVEIDLKWVTAKHTDEQRGYYWKYLKEWGAFLGYTARESEELLHNEVLCEAYGVRDFVTINNAVHGLPKERSSRQDRENYSLLIDTMIMLAAQTNFVVPRPMK